MINSPSPQSAGGQVMAKRQREKALANYYANPNLCKECHIIIPVREGRKIRETRDKQFCSMSCAGRFNNRVKVENGCHHSARARKIRPCVNCGKDTFRKDGSPRKYCTDCWDTQLNKTGNLKKEESTHPKIRGHARHRIKPSGKPCCLCGYTKHVDVCHIKPVASFSNDCILNIINDPINLILLCKNHHWELDNDLLEHDDQIKINHIKAERLAGLAGLEPATG